MKHINITNWQGNITDWTKFNYIYGGLDDTLADRVNLRIPGTDLRNYFRKSNNLLELANDNSYGIVYGNNFVVGQTYTLKLFTKVFRVKIATSSSQPAGDCLVSMENTNGLTNVTFTYANGSNWKLYLWGYGTSDNPNAGLLSDISTVQPMLVKGSTVPTTYEPYGSMVLVENVGRILGLTYENDIIVATTLGGLKCVVIQTDKDFIKDNFRTIVAKNNLNLTNVSANVQWSSTQVNVLACNNSQRILINFDQSLTDEEMIEKAKTLVLDYKLITPKVTVFNQVDLGTLSWIYTQELIFQVNISDIKNVNPSTIGNISCPKYTTMIWNNLADKGIATAIGYVRIKDSSYTNTTTFKEAMKGVILIYEAKDTSSANTLSMASPMQLDKTNVEEDIEYLEDTKFNEEILSEEE